MRLARRAMACDFEVLINAGQYPQGAEAALAALDLVDQLESQLTVYRETSEVSQINQHAFERDMLVERQLFALLRQAKELHRQTAGAYDITSGPLTQTWGFFRRAGRVPTDDEIKQALDRVGSQHLVLSEQSETVRYSIAGLQINLGSIGKGYALDRAAEVLQALGVKDFLMHGGQSSILARGSENVFDPAPSSAPRSTTGWRIGVRHPLRPGQSMAEITVRDRAVATSGAGQQFFYHEGHRYGHILDPRTGQPAEDVLSTTVLAPTAAEADALSTAFFVMGVDASLNFCQARPQIAALIVTPGEKTGSVDVYAHGLTESDWRLLPEVGARLATVESTPRAL